MQIPLAWALAWPLLRDCYIAPGCGNDSLNMWVAILWGSIPCGVVLYALVEFLVPYSERLELWLHRYGM